MITFRPLVGADFPTLLSWLQRSHVKEWWDDGDNTLEKVALHYARDPDNAKRFIALLDGQEIGYFQYHRFGDGHIGTDQFLADHRRLSKGLGTCCLVAFIDMIDSNEAPILISVDPHPKNKRAIRCYQKCEFVHEESESSPDVYFMARKR